MERIGMLFIDTRFNYGCTQAYYEIQRDAFDLLQTDSVS
jgi:hypothetical protein